MILIESSEASGKTLVVVPKFEGARPRYSVDFKTTDDECSFERFAELPLELRQQIYEESRPEPRVLHFDLEEVMVDATFQELRQNCHLVHEVKSRGNKSQNSRIFGLRHIRRVIKKICSRGRQIKQAAPPKPSDNARNLPWALLAVNKEAREWARRRYHLSFEGEIYRRGGLYVDFTRDTLLFANNKAFEALFAASENQNTFWVENNEDLPWPVHSSPGKMDKVLDQVRYLAIQDELEGETTSVLARFPSLIQVHLQVDPPLIPPIIDFHRMSIDIWKLKRSQEISHRKQQRLQAAMDRMTEMIIAVLVNRNYGQTYVEYKDVDDSEVKFLEFPEVKAWKLEEFQDEFPIRGI